MAYWKKKSNIEKFVFRRSKMKCWKLWRSCAFLVLPYFYLLHSSERKRSQWYNCVCGVTSGTWLVYFHLFFNSSSRQCCINMKLRRCIPKDEDRSQILKYILRRYKAPITFPGQSCLVKNKSPWRVRPENMYNYQFLLLFVCFILRFVASQNVWLPISNTETAASV